MHIIDLKPHAGAGIEAFVRWADVGSAIRRAFDRLYGPGALNPGHGHNFILYQNETREGATLLIGVLDRDPGGGDPDVKAVHVPGGRVITAPPMAGKNFRDPLRAFQWTDGHWYVGVGCNNQLG